jgi:hypothetical protein
MDYKERIWRDYGPDSSETRWVSAADFCENGNETWGSIK